jgi:hypothetical protein
MHFYFRQFNVIDEDIVSACYSHHGFCKTIFLWLCGIDIWVQCYIICLPSYFVGGKMHVSFDGIQLYIPTIYFDWMQLCIPTISFNWIQLCMLAIYLIGFSCAYLQFL